jgi:hypothetical protein
MVGLDRFRSLRPAYCPLSHFALLRNATIKKSTCAPDSGKLSCSRHGSDSGGGISLYGVNEEPEGRASMSLESHLAELQRKHGEIEQEIDEAMTHPSATDMEIIELKRRKLAIKDEMYKLRVSPTRH